MASVLREQVLGWKELKVIFKGDGMKRDVSSGLPEQRLFSMVAFNQMSPRNQDRNEPSGFSPRKRGAKPKGEQGGRREKD